MVPPEPERSYWPKQVGIRREEKRSCTGKSTKDPERKKEEMKQLEHKTVIFVEQTPRGELAKRLWETITRISPILGFGVKVVERSGSSLKSQFPQASLWEGSHCATREQTSWCESGGEDWKLPEESIPPSQSMGMLALCNQGADFMV